MEHSARHTVIFTIALCVAFSVVVSSVAVQLKDRQEENKRLDKIKNVLTVAGLRERDEDLGAEELMSRFEASLEAHVIDLETGAIVEGMSPLDFDQRRAAKDPSRSKPAPPNAAKVRRLPEHALVYEIKEEGATTGYILPIEGYGLWSTLYGYLALQADTKTVRGITYYEHGETPGLGGEVDNPRWKRLWEGRTAYSDDWTPALTVKKGSAGPPESDPYQVDGLSGATITSNGVTNMIQFWLGPEGFGPYLAEVRNQGDFG